MARSLKERVAAAIQHGIVVRHEYFVSIDLPDEQHLGSPATESEICQLEAYIGLAFPPSYRTFLQLHDGWKMIDGGVDLLSVQEQLQTRRHDIETWRDRMRSAGDHNAADALVIGWSSITPTRYLLDPSSIGADGEWRFVQHHKVEEAELASFIDWLEESIGEYRQLAEGQGDDDLDE